MKQKVREQEIEVEVVERQKQIELEEKKSYVVRSNLILRSRKS